MFLKLDAAPETLQPVDPVSAKLIIYEDEHLLVVNKPAGWNTHSPAPYAGEGIYEWLRHREPRWADLSIIHRLDKETSGLLVFGKTAIANRALSGQFENRLVRKSYLLVTDRSVQFRTFTARSALARIGARYASRPHGEPAETQFEFLRKTELGNLILARPVTGRTHQIRVHASENGFPILGDTLYEGRSFHRVCLHAFELRFKHPESGEDLVFSAEPDFTRDVSHGLREAVVDQRDTDSFRLIHGASDGWSGWYVEKLDGCLLSQSQKPLSGKQKAILQELVAHHGARAVYHKTLSRYIRGAAIQQTSPEYLFGEAVPDELQICENGVTFALRFNEGYSVGLFLDQRDNRRRFLVNHVAARFPLFEPAAQDIEVLNTFAYTCGFSVCAAKGGARVTSLDLSKKYLEWGKRNFELNGLDPAQHDFIYGDTFDWLRRLAKKGRAFDAIVLDPPTFSQSKESGVFRAEKDYGKLVQAALGVLKPDGVLLCSTNAADLKPERFREMIESGIAAAKRKVLQQHYAPQPPDFPVTREEPAYLKTVWMRIR